MKILIESLSNDTLLYRGVGFNNNKSNENYYGGIFFAVDEDDAYNFGDEIHTYKLLDASNIFTGESSQEYCEENNLMDIENPIVYKLSGYKTLNDAIEELLYCGKNPNLYYAIQQYIAKEHLSKSGFQGAEWLYEDDLVPHQVQIWDTSIVKEV